MSTLLKDLPDIVFAEKDTAVIEADVISYFENKIGRKLYDGDPIRLILLAFIKYMALQRNLIDFSGKQNLLRYAAEGYIQNIAALVGLEILPAAPAVTKLKFTISTPLPSATIIKKGTRATPGYKIYFATDDDVEIPAGELSVEVHATCTQTGKTGNGFYPGQVNQLSDPYPFNCTVENLEITQGGTDREDLEAFRERVHLAPESFSSAGAYGAYVFWAKTASQLITDVSATSPNPGEVEIIPLLRDGEIPTQALLNDVYKKCSDENNKPLTDKVIVRAPGIGHYDLDVRYFISRRDSPIGLSIQQKAGTLIKDYILWQKSKLGRDINPSRLVEMVMASGVKRIEVLSPVYTQVRYSQIAVPETVNIVYGGLEDD